MIKKLAAAVVVVILIIAIAMSGVAWYFSGKAMAINHKPDYSVKVVAADTNTVTLERTHDDVLPGAYGINWPNGGHALVNDITAQDNKTVQRRIVNGAAPPANIKVEWDVEAFTGDPSAVGLSFQDVNVTTPLGPMPAWFVNAPKSTWVVMVHGHDADRQTALRPMAALHADGFPVLDITYRNDQGAPATKDGKDRLGQTEWRDVDAAVNYADQNGATGVVLFGYSMGGQMVLHTARNSVDKDEIKGLILDSPVVDWKNTLDYQGGQNGLPLFETRLAETVFSWRSGFDFDDMNELKHAKDFTIPMLMFYGTADNYVPMGPAKQLAAARPDLVTAVEVKDATHIGSWNVNNTAYEQSVSSFMARFN